VSGDTLTITGPDLTNYLQNTGTQTIDNLSFNDNIISTSSNADLILSPGGTGAVVINGLSFPTSDGTNAQVLQTDGSGNISFADASGGGGGNNTAVRQIDFNHLTSTSVVDEFDIMEYRGAVYHIAIHDVTNVLFGQTTVNLVHDGSGVYISQYETNEDSANLVSFSASLSGTKVQLSATVNGESTHCNLRMYRIALGDHHETVSNTNSKIIKSATSIDSSATTIDQFTKTDVRSAKYYILIKNTTNGEYQISELSLTHDGTTVYFNDYGKTSTNNNHYLATFSADISSNTVSLKAIAGGGTEATAILYRIDLGSKTKLGTYDNVYYGKAGDVDSTIQTVDSFNADEFKSVKYFVSIGNSADVEYQNSEITIINNGTTSYITESLVRTGASDLATFTTDISNGKVRLRMAGTSSNNEIYFARISCEEQLVYRSSSTSSNDVFISGNNFKLNGTLVDFVSATGAITIPSGTSAQAPTGRGGMLRYNTTTGAYQKFDTNSGGFVDFTYTTSTASTDDASVPAPTIAIGTSAKVIDQFVTSAADSAFYYAVTRDEINGEVSTARYSVVHDDSNAFVTQSHMVESGNGTNPHISVDADISSGNVRLLATGTSVVNSVSLYKIILGDATSASTSGQISTIINTDVDSAAETIDSWSASTYRGAKYFISVNSTSQQELSNIECIVVHDGSNAYITAYNEHFTGNNSLISLTATLSAGNVILQASGNSPNLAVKMYRIILTDTESGSTGTSTAVTAATTVSSSATTIDSFDTGNYTGALYTIVGYNENEAAASIQEVMVVSDGSGAYVGAGPIVSTKDSDHLSFTATITGTTVSLKASSTSGASTTVNGYRVHMLRGEGGAATSNTVLVDTAQTITGTKTFDNPIALTVGSDPTTVANTAHIYAKDEASSAEVFVKDEAGNVTKISPHNEQGEWEYYSRNTKTGKTVRVNMEEMIRDIEKLTGKTYIQDK